MDKVLSDPTWAVGVLGGAAIVLVGVVLLVLWLTRPPRAGQRPPPQAGGRSRRRVGALRVALGLSLVVGGGLMVPMGLGMRTEVWVDPGPPRRVDPLAWMRPAERAAGGTASFPVVAMPGYVFEGVLIAKVTDMECGRTRIEQIPAEGRFCLVRLALRTAPEPPFHANDPRAEFAFPLQVAVTRSGKRLSPVHGGDHRLTERLNNMKEEPYKSGETTLIVREAETARVVLPYDVPRGQDLQKVILRPDFYTRPVEVAVAE